MKNIYKIYRNILRVCRIYISYKDYSQMYIKAYLLVCYMQCIILIYHAFIA